MYDMLLKVLRAWVRKFGLPPLVDGEALQDWLLSFFATAEIVAELIPGDWDDNFIKLADKVVGDDEAWAAIHEWLMVEFNGLPKSSEDQASLAPLGELIAKARGIDLDDVLDFLKWLISIVEMFFGKD